MSLPSLIHTLVQPVTRHPVKVVLMVGLLTILSIFGWRDLKLGGGIYELFPRSPGPISDFAVYARTFSDPKYLVVLVSGAERAQVERATRALTATLKRSPLIEKVRSSVSSQELSRALGPSLMLLPDADAWPGVQRRLTQDLERQVSRLRRILLSPLTPDRSLLVQDPLLLTEIILGSTGGAVNQGSGQFTSPDGKSALIFAEPRRPASDIAFCGELQGELERLARRHTPAGITLQFTGGHLYAYYLSRILKQDLTLSSVLALLGVGLVMLIFFRSLRLMPLSILVTGAAISWTLALAAVTVGGLNALTLSFAALCVGIGHDSLIHITAASRTLTGHPPAQRLQLAIVRISPALITASLTTIAAFLSFSLSSFRGLAMTGLLAACGLTLNLLLAMFFFPALAALLPPGAGPGQATLIDRGLGRVVGLVVGRARGVLLAVVLLCGGAFYLSEGIRFSEDLARLAPADLPPARTDRAIAERFERHRNRLVVIVKGDTLQPVLQVNDAVARRLAGLKRDGQVASYQSLAGLLPSMDTQRRRLARLEALGPHEVARHLEQALQQNGLRVEAFQPFLTSLTTPRFLGQEHLTGGLEPLVRRQLARADGVYLAATTVYLRPSASAVTLAATLQSLETTGASVGVTGAAPAGKQMARLLERDLKVIALATLGVVLIMLGVLLRRPWPVLATLLSLTCAGILFLGGMGLWGQEMDLYDLMVIPIIIGYGVDDHLYIIHRASQAGLRRGVVESSRPVLASTLSSMAAFGALGLCQLPGLRTLGLTGAMGLTLGLFASVVILPALLALAPAASGSPHKQLD